MKKILLSLFAVLMTVGAWAQPTASDAPSNGQWAANTTWYTMKNGNGHYINKDYADGNGNLKWDNNKASIEDAALWCIVGDAENGYLFYNKSAGTTEALTTTGADANARTNFAKVASATKFFFAESKKKGYWCVKIAKEGNNYWNARDGYVALWNSTDAVNGWGGSGSGDNGSAILFEEVDVDGIETLTYTLVDASDNVYSGTYEGFRGTTKPTLNGVAGYTLANEAWDGTKFTATITFPFPVSKVSGTTNATMISAFGDANHKWFADGTAVKERPNVEATPENVYNYMWAIYPTFVEGAFTFTIKNIGVEKYISSTSDANNHAEGVVVLAETGTAFTVDASNQFKLPTGKYLSINSSSSDNQILGTWGSHNGTKNTFPIVSFGVTIGTTGFATVYSPFDVTLPEGLTAYAVESASANKVMLTAKEGIKANEGVVLQGTAKTTYKLTVGEVTADWSSNLLQGTLETVKVEGPAYVLSNIDGPVGFYQVELDDENKFQNNAGRAYLPVSAGGARFLSFDFGGNETAIDELKGENGNVKAVIYDLAGRRVQGAQKGIYVVNGKVVIK